MVNKLAQALKPVKEPSERTSLARVWTYSPSPKRADPWVTARIPVDTHFIYAGQPMQRPSGPVPTRGTLSQAMEPPVAPVIAPVTPPAPPSPVVPLGPAPPWQQQAADTFSFGGRNAPFRDMVPNTEPLPEQKLAMALGIPRDRLVEAAYAGRVRGINRVDAPPRQFPREFTPDSPATPEEIQRAFYGPSEPGSPPPEMSQAEYQRRKAMREGSAERLTPEEREAFFARAGVDPSALGAPIANPLQDRLRGDLTGLSPEEQAAGRLIQSTQGHNPPRPVMPVPAPGPGEAGFGEGYYQGQSGVTVPGVGRRASNQVMGSGRVGTGYQSTGMNTGGAFGSQLMMGQMPAPAAPAARRAPAGGYLDFNEWLAAREAKPEDTPSSEAGMPLGRNVTTRGPDGSLTIENVPIVGGWPANMGKTPVPAPPPAPVPAPPPAPTRWPPNMQPRPAPAPGPSPGPSQAPRPGFFRRNWPVGAGVGIGSVITAILGGMGGSPGVTAPVGMHPSQAGDPSLQPAPVPSSPYWAARQKAVRSRFGTPTPESIADARARNDMISRRPTLPYPERAALVAERGIARGQGRRDALSMRRGIAGPELESRYYLARNPEVNAKIMAERARTEGYVGAAREEAAGAIGAAEATASAFRDTENSKALLAIMADPAATPEMKAWAQDRLQGLVGSGEQQVIQPVTQPVGQAPAPGSRPVVGEIDPNAGDIRKQQEEILRQEKAQAEFDAQAARVQSGDAKGVIDNDPEIDSLVSSGVRPEYVVQRMIAKYPGMSRDAAMKEVQRRAGKWSGYMDMVVPMY